MNEVGSRAPFFPNSNSAKNADRLRKAEYGVDGAPSSNAPSRSEEITANTKAHARVDIPESVRDFAAIKKAAVNAPDIDNSKKIQDLKNRIANNTYEIDYDAVAEKMLSSEF
jgi:flagellar biosynthesis anti-sigma factor FlgM